MIVKMTITTDQYDSLIKWLNTNLVDFTGDAREECLEGKLRALLEGTEIPNVLVYSAHEQDTDGCPKDVKAVRLLSAKAEPSCVPSITWMHVQLMVEERYWLFYEEHGPNYSEYRTSRRFVDAVLKASGIFSD